MIALPEQFFDLKKLDELAEKNKEKYQNAKPFSHIAFDDFLNEAYLKQVLSEFPKISDPQWVEFKAESENGKLASTAYTMIPPVTRYVLDQLNTPPFLNFLEKLTGINGLIPDPYYVGGGMHQTKKSGLLGIHVDFNRYEKLGLYRRVNVLLYLNEGWEESYGGALELWDEKMTTCHEKILPIFNRCAIFTTSENSHHGHPDPLTCPEGMTRKSLAWYYYTSSGDGVIDDKPHTTLYRSRPGRDKSFKVMKFRNFIRSYIPDPVVGIIKKVLKTK